MTAAMIVDLGDEGELEFATQLRGREVSCRLQDGQLVGDPELVERMIRCAARDFQFDTLSLAHHVHDAVGSDVIVRFRTPVSMAELLAER